MVTEAIHLFEEKQCSAKLNLRLKQHCPCSCMAQVRKCYVRARHHKNRTYTMCWSEDAYAALSQFFIIGVGLRMTLRTYAALSQFFRHWQEFSSSLFFASLAAFFAFRRSSAIFFFSSFVNFFSNNPFISAAGSLSFE